MILLDLLSITLAAFTMYQIRQLRVEHNARLTTLERREPEKRVQAPAQPVYEKPVVPGAKKVKALGIGEGDLNVDKENHVYEWM